MARDMEQDFVRAMDAVRFSQQAKEDMAVMLTDKLNEQKRTRPGGRRLLVLSLAAAIAMTIFTGAGIYSRWSRTAAVNYKLSETQKKAAEKSGFSTLLEETAEAQASGETAASAPQAEAPLISATDKGITITAVQTLVDKYRAHLVFRIDGFTLPEGKDPSIEGGVVTINGKDPMVSGGAQFYDGYTAQRDGTVTYADGSPTQRDANGNGICHYTDENGSLEYSIDLYFPLEDTKFKPGYTGLKYKEHLGSEIVVKFTSIGVSDYLDHVPMVDGDWTLKWTLTGSDDTRTVEINKPIGDTGFTLLSAELTPASCVMTMEGDAYSHKSAYVDEYYYWIPHLKGVILKDGSFTMVTLDGANTYALEDNLHRENAGIVAPIPGDVKSLVFWPMTHEWPTAEEIIVPLS